MKKRIALFLTLVMCLSLCACGKSEAVKNAEAQIAALTDSSTYEEIYAAYSAYCAVADQDREKVKNIDELATYCDISSRYFVLTGSMLDEIKKDFTKTDFLDFTSPIFAIWERFRFQQMALTPDWNNFGNIEFVSYDKTSDYTYTGYGTLKVQDKYGFVTKHKFHVQYHAEFDEESLSYRLRSEAFIDPSSIS